MSVASQHIISVYLTKFGPGRCWKAVGVAKMPLGLAAQHLIRLATKRVTIRSTGYLIAKSNQAALFSPDGP